MRRFFYIILLLFRARWCTNLGFLSCIIYNNTLNINLVFDYYVNSEGILVATLQVQVHEITKFL